MASSTSFIDPQLVLSHKFPEYTFSYDERDVAMYALGIGACIGDPFDDKELKYVYHRDGQPFIKICHIKVKEIMTSERTLSIHISFPSQGRELVMKVKAIPMVLWNIAYDNFKTIFIPIGMLYPPFQVLPTFAAILPFKTKIGLGLSAVPGLQFDPRLLLHGQQYIEIYKPFPSSSYIQNKVSIAGLHDKGKAAIIELETTSYIKESGEALCMSRSTIYLRGAGGFSKSSPPYSFTSYPINQDSRVSIPNSKPSVVHEEFTQPSQALLYRLSGDYNPLHSDPMIAQAAGFSRPILHGLCTLGFAVRAVVKCICNGDETAVKSIFGRFLLHVYPGETLVTEMWPEGTKVTYQTKVKERNRSVLSGYVVLKHISSSL